MTKASHARIDQANELLRVGRYPEAVEAYSALSGNAFSPALTSHFRTVLLHGTPHAQVAVLQILSDVLAVQGKGVARVSTTPSDHQAVFEALRAQFFTGQQSFIDLVLENLPSPSICHEVDSRPVVRSLVVIPAAMCRPVPCHAAGAEYVVGELRWCCPEVCVDIAVHDMHAEYLETGADNNSLSQSLLNRIDNYDLDLICLSARIDTWEATSAALRVIPHDVPILLGGTIPTFSYAELLSEFPHCTCALGEGELAIRGVMQSLVHGLRAHEYLPTVPNIAYVDSNGEIHVTRRQIIEAEDISTPDRTVFSKLLCQRSIGSNVESSRGCAFSCSYCSIEPFRGTRRVRAYPVVRLLNELEDLTIVARATPSSPLSIHFTDDDFVGGDLGRAQEIARGMVARRLNSSLLFHMETRVDHVWNPSDSLEKRSFRRQVFEQLREAGLSKVFLGIESGCESQLRRYGKGTTLHVAKQAVDTLNELGIDVEAGFIMFDPFVCLEEIKKNAIFLKNSGVIEGDTRPDKCLRAQAGSRYTQRIAREGLIVKPQDENDREAYEEICRLSGLPQPGVYDVNKVCYGYRFWDPRVRDLLRVLLPWSRQMDELLGCLQTICRADSVSKSRWKGTSRKLHSHLIELRRLILDMMVELCDHFEANRTVGETVPIVQEYNGKRDVALRALGSTLNGCRGHDSGRSVDRLEVLSAELRMQERQST